MYYHAKAKLVFLAHPRTASVATSLALRDCGFQLLDGYGHHTLLNRAKFVMEERSKWTTFTMVRNHWDAAVSWILKVGWVGEICADGTECRVFKADWSKDCFRMAMDNNGFIKNGQMWGHHMADADTVFFYEGLSGNLRSWLREFDITLPPIRKENMSKSRDGRHYHEFYTDETRDYIGDRFRNEIEIFGYRF